MTIIITPAFKLSTRFLILRTIVVIMSILKLFTSAIYHLKVFT